MAGAWIAVVAAVQRVERGGAYGRGKSSYLSENQVSSINSLPIKNLVVVYLQRLVDGRRYSQE